MRCYYIGCRNESTVMIKSPATSKLAPLCDHCKDLIFETEWFNKAKYKVLRRRCDKE